MPIADTSPARRWSSDQMRIYIWSVAAFLVAGLTTAALAVLTVDRMKNELVKEAKEFVHEGAVQVGVELTGLLNLAGARSLTSLDEDDRADVVRMMRQHAENQAALTTFTLIEDGVPVYLINRDGEESGLLVGEDSPVKLPDPITEEAVTIPLEFPSGGSEQRVLEILYHLSPQRVESSLKATSEAITRSTWIIVSLLLLLLLAVIVVLARVLSHLMALHDETHRLDRLAYIGTLSAGLAHEIRNPLNAMSINLDMIDDDLGTDSTADPSTRRLVSGVKAEIVHLNKIVENFLAYARPSRRTPETLDLGNAAREAVAALEAEFDARGVRCQIGRLPTGAVIEIDPTSLHQALGNILLNAAQAMDKPERLITVTGQSDGHHVDLSITDTGRGIPPDQLENIFEVFYTAKTGGAGLGLPTAKRVIGDVGGSISVDSIAGHGTQVTITLPLAKRRRR